MTFSGVDALHHLCSVRYLRVCVCMYVVYVCSQGHGGTCTCVYMCMEAIHQCGVFLGNFPPYLLRQSLSLNQELADWPNWLTSKLQGSNYLPNLNYVL